MTGAQLLSRIGPTPSPPAPPSPASSATPAQQDRGSTRAPRVAWIDASRAVAVLLVVIFHVTIGHYYLMDWATGEVTSRWDRVNQILSVIRMPLLFALSGMLASGKIRRGFGGGQAIAGAVTNYYLYAVWLFAYGAFILVLPAAFPAPHEVDSIDRWIVQLWAPNTYLWYLFALAVYIVAFTALRRVPGPVIIGVLFFVHIAAVEVWSVQSVLWTRALTYALFFGIGVYGRRALTFMAGSPAATLVGAAVSYGLFQQIGMTQLMSTAPPALDDAVLLVFLYIAMGATAVGFVGCVVRVSWMARLLSGLGRHTLGIYVLHIPMATVLNLLVLGPLGWTVAAVPGNETLHLLYPLIASAVVVGMCIAAEVILRGTPARYLFEVPRWLKDACETARSRAAGEQPALLTAAR